ncbi:DUF2563 family protein [uncultured Mycobacterium sp.]|uniref:DUF2563 family protein n=1 Tax=uncultured Mycobacterium sp. TaxID=171292 RepID=UPI0035CBDA73
MYVNTGLLHAGTDDSHRAGQHADDGANHLAGTSPVSGMFGNFDAAHTFCDAVPKRTPITLPDCEPITRP